MLGEHGQDFVIEELDGMQHHNDEHHQQMDDFVVSHAAHASSNGTGLSTQLNVNHEIHHATKNMLLSVKDLIATNAQMDSPSV